MNRAFICIIFAVLTTIVAASPNSYNVVEAIDYDEETGMPTSLSGDEFIIVRDVALSDPRVQELIAGRNYVITDCCGFYQSGPSAPWQPVLNLRVANELQIGARVDLDAREVVKIESGPAVQLAVPRHDTTAADEMAESYNNDGRSIPILATNNPTVLSLVFIVGIVLGGAAAGVFYYLKRVNCRLAAKRNK